MPYTVYIERRYIGEHSCGQHHYGDMSLVRACCVEDAIRWYNTAERVALTNAHPAVEMFNASWNSLTDAERHIVKERLAAQYSTTADRVQLIGYAL